MTDDRLVDDRAERVVALLESSVGPELQVTNGGFNLGLSDETFERLMQGVTSGLLYAFAIDWSPDWIKPGDVHRWNETGRFFARCGVCLADPHRRRTKSPLWSGLRTTRRPTDRIVRLCRCRG